MKTVLCKHYKGGYYNLLMNGTHTETGEDVVVYEDSEGRRWIRPAEMFHGEVKVDGKMVPRFELIGTFGDFK
ncbi:DUF1653 domain-containing protein [Oceanobacillus kimchii]|uniref:DUF1653 domain-containing protein n=1 Tax=Oceanobacillus kimchii TaxID=746691 RepID=A0ABQ5TJU0_9BACI|nr:DUF1653 domain-containing protein [Oceanobacillus kimchii]GLO66270.1 hypothetical protein MACH08_20540 [Oceanobacillus kimchii]